MRAQSIFCVNKNTRGIFFRIHYYAELWTRFGQIDPKTISVAASYTTKSRPLHEILKKLPNTAVIVAFRLAE